MENFLKRYGLYMKKVARLMARHAYMRRLIEKALDAAATVWRDLCDGMESYRHRINGTCKILSLRHRTSQQTISFRGALRSLSQIKSGHQILHVFGRSPAGFTWPWSWIYIPARLSVGPWEEQWLKTYLRMR